MVYSNHPSQMESDSSMLHSVAKARLADVDNNLRAVAAEMERSPQIPVMKLLIGNQTLQWWASVNRISLDDIEGALAAMNFSQPNPIDEFWGVCQKYGIQLTPEEKNQLVEKLYQDLCER